MIDRLEAIAKRYREIDSEMARPDVATDHEKLTRLAREQRSMREIVAAYDAFRRALGREEGLEGRRGRFIADRHGRLRQDRVRGPRSRRLLAAEVRRRRAPGAARA